MTLFGAVGVAAVLALSISFSEPDPLGNATAALTIEWEDPSKATERYQFFRRRSSPEGDDTVWTVARAPDSEIRGEVLIEAGSCPDLEIELDKLETMTGGTVVAPLSSTMPTSVSNRALYTLWGRSRAEGGYSQTVMIRTLAGPVGEWAEGVRTAIHSCASAS